MVGSTELYVTEARPVVVQRASGAEAASLRAAAERLRAAAHPGVVEVVSTGGAGDEWEVITVHGGRPLDLVGPLTVERVAEVATAVATTLADLHDAGIVHGRLDAHRVLIGTDGRPRLHGFADPATLEVSPADDVAAVGHLLVDLVQAAESGRRSRSRRRLASALLHVADLARAEPPTRRPPARRLATAIAGVLPSPGVPPRSAPRHAAARRTGHRRVAVLGLATAVVAGGLALWPERSRSSPDAGTSSPHTAPSTPRSMATAAAAPAPSRPASLTFEGRRYEVGRPGDVVRVGDWDCDGRPTPAVLRPATGEVFVFGGWPDAGEVTAAPVTRVPGATDLQPSGSGPACPALIALRPDGHRVEVDGTGSR